MSYTNVVFRQNVGRTVNRDQIEKQRIDDRGTLFYNLSRISNSIPNRRQSNFQSSPRLHT